MLVTPSSTQVIDIKKRFNVLRPHRRTTYVDAAYILLQTEYYGLTVSLLVCRSLSVTVVSPAKTDEPTEMPFGLWTRVGPRNHVLDAVQIPMGMGIFEGRARAAHYKVQRRSALNCAKWKNL